MERYREQEDIREQNEDDAAEYAFVLIDRIKEMLREQAELKRIQMEMEANEDEACNFMDDLIGKCLASVDADQEFYLGCDDRIETQEDHFTPRTDL